MSDLSALVIDAGWYADPYGGAFERYNNGNGWTGRTRMPGTTQEFVEPDVTPRPAALRMTATIAATVLSLVLYVGAIVLLVEGGFFWIGGMILLLGWALFVILAGPPVGYSRLFALALIVPLVAIFLVPYVTGRIVSRFVMLPYRTWPITAPEADLWQQVRDPRNPGGLLYVRRDWHQ